MIKLIVSDLDGTLLTRFKSITKENQEAAYRASKATDYILDDVATYLIMKGVTDDDKDKIIEFI